MEVDNIGGLFCISEKVIIVEVNTLSKRIKWPVKHLRGGKDYWQGVTVNLTPTRVGMKKEVVM